jgi:hypothetical protein
VDKSKEGEKALVKAKYLLDKDHVLVFKLVNQPGMLGKVAKRIGEVHVNIDYIYGSAMEDAKESIFVVRIAEIDFDKVKASLKDL